MTFVVPCLIAAEAGTLPENWELAIQFPSARPDFDVFNITSQSRDAPANAATAPGNLSSVSTLNGITLGLNSVAEMPDGYLFTGR